MGSMATSLGSLQGTADVPSQTTRSAARFPEAQGMKLSIMIRQTETAARRMDSEGRSRGCPFRCGRTRIGETPGRLLSLDGLEGVVGLGAKAPRELDLGGVVCLSLAFVIVGVGWLVGCLACLCFECLFLYGVALINSIVPSVISIPVRFPIR